MLWASIRDGVYTAGAHLSCCALGVLGVGWWSARAIVVVTGAEVVAVAVNINLWLLFVSY